MTETAHLFDELFSVLSKVLPSYEPRDDQQKMAQEIWDAFEKECPALFEAGTGTGKSLAYLIPVLIWSYKTGEKVVISTYTISLQEQLLEKDIPLLMQALGLDLRVVLSKGMSNYVCMRKVEERAPTDEGVEEIQSWAYKSKDGTKSSLPIAVPSSLWQNVCAESDACSYIKCPHYQECFFFRARNKVQDADVIIVNHHLLMANLLADEKQAILPPYTRLIIDEAHHLESVARSSLTNQLDRVQLFKTLARVHSDNHPEVSRFLLLSNLLGANENKALDRRLNIDLPAEKRALITTIQNAFDLLEDHFACFSSAQKWHLTDQQLNARDWKEKIAPAFDAMRTSLKRYASSLDSLEDEFEKEQKERAENAFLDISAAVERIKEACALLEEFFTQAKENEVRWAEKTPEGVRLSLAELDVADYLGEKLFKSLKSTILCSATLSVDGSFDHIEKNLGVTSQERIEKIYPSPFDFKERTRLYGFPSSHPQTPMISSLKYPLSSKKRSKFQMGAHLSSSPPTICCKSVHKKWIFPVFSNKGTSRGIFS